MSKNVEVKHRQKMGTVISFTPTGEHYFTKALKAYQRQEYHKAKKYLERAIQLDPDEPNYAIQLAIVCTELGDFRESNRILHHVLEDLDEDMTECHYFLANNYAHLGFFKDAYHHATLYLDVDEEGEFADDTEDLLDLLTLEAEETGDTLYEQDDLISKQEETRELLESGKFLQAVNLLKSLIKDFPEYWSAYNNLALAYFYLGDTEKAEATLNDVLSKNPGNLHALCNKLVFAHYTKDTVKVKALTSALVKIKPILIEQQFKLGATLALVGEYETAFSLLKKLQKQGFDGDEPYYYWLAYSAYFTGKSEYAKKVWKKVLELNPEKEGHEPWNKERSLEEGLEDQQSVITKIIQSEQLEERLFGLFLTSLSDKKEEILSSFQASSPIEEQYLRFLFEKSTAGEISSIAAAHETAKELFYFHHPIRSAEAGLYLMWFSVLVEMEKDNVFVKNNKACAAAVEYIWRKLRNEKYSQKYFAKQYNLSLSTMQKYVKIVNKYLS
jgi:tetratricopeptide (TPR) repeat protein